MCECVAVFSRSRFVFSFFRCFARFLSKILYTNRERRAVSVCVCADVYVDVDVCVRERVFAFGVFRVRRFLFLCVIVRCEYFLIETV